jgi:hypothetical protein
MSEGVQSVELICPKRGSYRGTYTFRHDLNHVRRLVDHAVKIKGGEERYITAHVGLFSFCCAQQLWNDGVG